MTKREVCWCLIGLFVGITLGIGTFFAIAKPTTDRLLAGLQRCNADNQQLREQNENLKGAAIQALARQRTLEARENSLFEQGTVLYEAAPQSAGAGLLAVLAGVRIPAQAGMVPRWFIPARIKPIIYGDPQSVRVIYIDAQGRTEPGAPEILPQGVQ